MKRLRNETIQMIIIEKESLKRKISLKFTIRKQKRSKQTKMCRMKNQKEWFKDLADLQSYSLNMKPVVLYLA